MLAYKLDEVNVDFQRFYVTDSGGLLNSFMAELTSYLHNEIPGCEDSFAGPHYNWGGNWKFAGWQTPVIIYLLWVMRMPEALANIPVKCPILGGTQNITNTLTQRYGSVLNCNPKKLILGVPYYGNKWFTRTKDPHAAV